MPKIKVILTFEQYEPVIKDIIKKKIKKGIDNRQQLFDGIVEELTKTYKNSLFNSDLILKIMDANVKSKITESYYFEEGSVDLNAIINPTKATLVIPTEYKQIERTFEYLKNCPQPAQKSREWYVERQNMLTASDVGTAVHANHNSSEEELIVKKSQLEPPFETNMYTFHGIKYEFVSTQIYEQIMNCRVEEFGLIKHKTVKFLGASPDGIVCASRHDGTFSPLFGRMLEIKNPPKREIKTKGELIGEICPEYYWVQVQIQLETCELEECDFWQTKIVEYESRGDCYRDSAHQGALFHEQEERTEYDPRKTSMRGCIVEFVPIAKQDVDPLYEGKYLYPPLHTHITVEAQEQWCLDALQNWKQFAEANDLTWARDYTFRRLCYWKLEKGHRILIKRDRKWFADTLPTIAKFWDRVMECRKPENAHLLEEITEMAEEIARKRQEKYTKYSKFAPKGAAKKQFKHVAEDPFLDDPSENVVLDNGGFISSESSSD
jgi:putative phage-type endonuclease